MEVFAMYLLKSVIWLSGFALVYLLFLRNERFFRLNRLYLVSGILTSFFLPFISLHYIIDLPGIENIQAGNATVSGFQGAGNSHISGVGLLLLALYISGALFVTLMIIKQSISVLRSVKKAEIITSHPVKLIKSADYSSSFSFFSYVFVNPSVTDVETEEIVNHELVHIRQMHWVDLVLVELLCILQWFNPLIWIYLRFIRQNHEYLADEMALQRTSDPAIYRATLLNQIVGSPVVSLANSFNYSLNKKRFNMMKNIISSPYRKMKIFLVLPVFAIILYAFAKPEYRFNYDVRSPGINTPVSNLQQDVVKGTVVQKDGKALQGAAVIIRGTTIGTTTDANGSFALSKVPGDASLAVSYVGFKAKIIKPVFTSEMKIVMVRDTLKYGTVSTPPPPPGLTDHPLIVLNGKVSNVDLNKLNPNTIDSIKVIKNEAAIKKYGDKGKDGVIEITTYKNDWQIKQEQQVYAKVEKVEEEQTSQKAVFVLVEEMPQFPGGQDAMNRWIAYNIKYPAEAVKKNITGQVYVRFVVSSSGKISDVKVVQPVNPLLDEEAVRVISSMPDWKPGMQGGKPVDVYIKVPVNFNLK